MFFGLYFFCRHFWPERSGLVLFAVILAGVVFGFAQQLRGAHFISHDLTTALICWSVTLLLWRHWASHYLPNPIKRTVSIAAA
jgi:membrane-associated PAP2 superfamily phosphatase